MLIRSPAVVFGVITIIDHIEIVLVQLFRITCIKICFDEWLWNLFESQASELVAFPFTIQQLLPQNEALRDPASQRENNHNPCANN